MIQRGACEADHKEDKEVREEVYDGCGPNFLNLLRRLNEETKRKTK